MTEKTYEQKLDNLNDLIAIQSADGNWDVNEYMRGLANGLLLAKSCFVGGDVEFHKALPNPPEKDA